MCQVAGCGEMRVRIGMILASQLTFLIAFLHLAQLCAAVEAVDRVGWVFGGLLTRFLLVCVLEGGIT